MSYNELKFIVNVPQSPASLHFVVNLFHSIYFLHRVIYQSKVRPPYYLQQESNGTAVQQLIVKMGVGVASLPVPRPAFRPALSYCKRRKAGRGTGHEARVGVLSRVGILLGDYGISLGYGYTELPLYCLDNNIMMSSDISCTHQIINEPVFSLEDSKTASSYICQWDK